jgi:hypothetical protein
MENRGNSTSYPSRGTHSVQQPLPDGYSKKGASYRRPIDAQPTPAQLPVQPTSNTIPSNFGRPVAAAPAANGISRSSSHRRRQSQQIPPPTIGSSVEPLPAAPDVPRGPPPTAYRDPYAPKGGSRGHGRSYQPGRSRDPPIQLNTSRQQASVTIPAERLQQLRSPPYLPVEPLSGTIEGPARRNSGRRPSVPDRSPLQKLEGKLDDISKEERRARILEIELAAQEKAEADMRARRAREAAAKQQRVVSGPVPGAEQAPVRTTSNKRHVSMPIDKQPKSPLLNDLSESEDGYGYDLSEPWNPAAGQPSQRLSSGSQRQKHPLNHGLPAVGRTSSLKGKEPVDSSRGAGSFRDRAETTTGADTAGHSRQQYERKPVPVPTGLGLYGVDDTPHASRQVGADVARYDSRRLSKDLPPTPKETANSKGRRRDSRGIIAAQEEMERQRNEQPNEPRGLDHLTPTDAPTAPAANRRSVGFADVSPEVEPDKSSESQHHFANVFSSHHEPDRRYVPPMMLEEWKKAPIGLLAEHDLDLEAAGQSNGNSSNGNKAWWEESTSSRQRRSSSYAEPTYDGYVDTPTTQTSFNPPLHLKCGPLLRYTGLRKDKSTIGKDREIWRGSVMIVTIDEQSSYQKPPMLRLFKQPMDLLPPPPAEIDGDDLHPSYVDPLEGQVKVSRTGKTLYVKPIDMIPENEDLSRIEDHMGFFADTRSSGQRFSRIHKKDGERLGKVREIPGVRLHAERGVTFWRFSLEIELGTTQERIAYRINRGPAIGFWVPAKGETMNMMFHSCNGFSLSVDSKQFCGPDPMWRDVLNSHQTRPFHVMIGGGDQIYNDAAMRDTVLFKQWTESKNPLQKHSTPFSDELQHELEQFYLDRYSMWFSQGLFGMANSQIPMINIWDDHDIIDVSRVYLHMMYQSTDSTRGTDHILTTLCRLQCLPVLAPSLSSIICFSSISPFRLRLKRLNRHGFLVRILDHTSKNVPAVYLCT